MLIVVYTFVVKHKQQTMAKLKRTMSRPERCRSPPCVRQKLSRQLSWHTSTAASLSYHPYHTWLVIVMVIGGDGGCVHIEGNNNGDTDKMTG